MRSGTFNTATPYSKLAMVSSSAKLPAWRQTNTSPRGLEAEFRCDARVGAAQHRGKRILALGERFALVLEVVPPADAFDVAGIALHQLVKGGVRVTARSPASVAPCYPWRRRAPRKGGGKAEAHSAAPAAIRSRPPGKVGTCLVSLGSVYVCGGPVQLDALTSAEPINEQASRVRGFYAKNCTKLTALASAAVNVNRA